MFKPCLISKMRSLISLTLRTKFMNGATCAGHFCRGHYWAFSTTDEPTSKPSAVLQVPSSAVSFCIDRDITLFHVAREDLALRVSPHFLLVVSLFKIFFRS